MLPPLPPALPHRATCFGLTSSVLDALSRLAIEEKAARPASMQHVPRKDAACRE
jgi:hypothetical protein